MAFNRVATVDRMVPVRNVIISVFDKTGLDRFVDGLVGIVPDLAIWSTGGTYSAIEKILGARAGAHLRSVSEYTGQPELQGGLVKTLDWRIYLGLLAEPYNPHHGADIERTGAVAFDMVVANLYPFGEASGKAGSTIEDARGHIDIGGPCMLRAAAKNFLRVASVCDPADYQAILRELEATGGALSLETRFSFARKTFTVTAGYDAAIASHLGSLVNASLESCYTISGQRSGTA